VLMALGHSLAGKPQHSCSRGVRVVESMTRRGERRDFIEACTSRNRSERKEERKGDAARLKTNHRRSELAGSFIPLESSCFPFSQRKGLSICLRSLEGDAEIRPIISVPAAIHFFLELIVDLLNHPSGRFYRALAVLNG
jgi:hypothetical protein